MDGVCAVLLALCWVCVRGLSMYFCAGFCVEGTVDGGGKFAAFSCTGKWMYLSCFLFLHFAPLFVRTAASLSDGGPPLGEPVASEVVGAPRAFKFGAAVSPGVKSCLLRGWGLNFVRFLFASVYV